MESLNMTQQSFAKYLGISSPALSSIYSGRTRLTLATVEAIHEKLPAISMNWLLYGEGDMYAGAGAQGVKSEPVAAPIQQPEIDFDEQPAEPAKVVGQRVKKAASGRDGSSADLKIVDNGGRHIIEIKVYYDDLTYESFVPAKNK